MDAHGDSMVVAGSPELIKHIHSELRETGNTAQKANVIAVGKAKNWVDQQSIG
jgi:hypothetical protein